MKITQQTIKDLRPCIARYDNFLQHYPEFEGSAEEFLDLENISHQDKLWVILRLLPRFEVEVFAIDCATYAATYATCAADAVAYAATYATDATCAADAAAYAAATAHAAAAHAADAHAADAASAARKEQIKVLKYLTNNIGN